MAQNRFASVPNISIPRSRFKQPFNHSTSFNHGQLIPIDCFDILPGDTYKLDLASLIWMSNPIRPIFGNITAHVDVFFVPMRLVWDYTKQFFGENVTSAGPNTTTYTIPSVKLGSSSANGQIVSYFSLSHYLGKPIAAQESGYNANYGTAVSVLKERAYLEIWNNYYRAQQLQNPFIIEKGGNGTYASTDGYYLTKSGSATQRTLNSYPLLVNKEFDYFTAATLYPQYGNAVTLPLGSYAKLATMPSNSVYDLKQFGTTSSGVVKFGVNGESLTNTTAVPYFAVTGTNQSSGVLSMDHASYSPYDDMGSVDQVNLVADLSNATAATINQLRYAFAVQKYLERSNFGSRFFEMLQVHYGVTSPDATLQIPQRIGHADFAINISTVLSTAGAATDSSTELGMPGATSCTANKKYLFTHAFIEPGYLFVLLSTTHERSYTQGILREDKKLDRYEIYSPEFANLGDQEVVNDEIFYDPTSSSNHSVFGYQEHWAEYRYRPHRVSGILDPQAANALDFWVLTDDYATRPSLDGTWIQENRDFASRCLVSGLAGPDYIGDFYFDYVATREMPLFTIPGLIDHFGER